MYYFAPSLLDFNARKVSRDSDLSVLAIWDGSFLTVVLASEQHTLHRRCTRGALCCKLTENRGVVFGCCRTSMIQCCEVVFSHLFSV